MKTSIALQWCEGLAISVNHFEAQGECPTFSTINLRSAEGSTKLFFKNALTLRDFFEKLQRAIEDPHRQIPHPRA